MDLGVFPQSTEFWAGVIGALVGGIATFLVERIRVHSTIEQEWRRVKDQDLRAFQDAVHEAINDLEIDLADAHRIGIHHVATEGWHPTRSHASFEKARKLAVRVREPVVRGEWSKMETRIRQSRSSLGAAMSAADPNNPWVKQMDPHVQQLARQAAEPELLDAIAVGATVRQMSKDLWKRFDEAFERLMT